MMRGSGALAVHTALAAIRGPRRDKLDWGLQGSDTKLLVGFKNAASLFYVTFALSKKGANAGWLLQRIALFDSQRCK